MTIPTTTYIMSGIPVKTTSTGASFDRVYYAVDSGYPYWAAFAEHARSFVSLDTISNVCVEPHMRKEITSIELLEVTTQYTVMSTEQIISAQQLTAQNEIAALQSTLAAKIAALKAMT